MPRAILETFAGCAFILLALVAIEWQEGRESAKGVGLSKPYTGTIQCQGCDTKTKFAFKKPSYFVPSVASVKCPGCQSKFLVHILKNDHTGPTAFEYKTEITEVSDKFKELWLEKEDLKANIAALESQLFNAASEKPLQTQEQSQVLPHKPESSTAPSP